MSPRTRTHPCVSRKVPFCSLHCLITACRRSRSASVVDCSATQDERGGSARTTRTGPGARARAVCSNAGERAPRYQA
eukprot:5949513-Prymnesium_polylepis.1